MNEETLYFDEKARLNFVVWGDPQVSSVNPMREKRLVRACRDLAEASGRADALVMVGDITEYGKKNEYKAAADALEKAKDKFGRLICVPGNHDIRLRRFKKQAARFQDFVKSVTPCDGMKSGRYYHSCEINGYRFIMMGADRASFESAYISEKQLSWLDGELSSAQKSGKPIFVFNHQTLKRMNGLPETWLGKGSWRGSVGKQSDKIKAIFEKHGNIFFITGHLHFGVNEFTFEDRGRFKLLSVPTLGAANHGQYSAEGQGYIISVYDDRVVMRAREFCAGRYTEEKIENSAVEIKLT